MNQQLIQDLDELAHKARLSVNMKPKAFLRFLDGEPRRNRYEQAAYESAQSGIPAESILAGQKYHEERNDFERQAGGGHYFHYAALNVGGLGAPTTYGRYCVVDGQVPTPDHACPVWVAEDTITGRRFRDENGSLDWEQLRAWVAPSNMSMKLAAIKLGRDDPQEPLEKRICSDDDYIEALSLKPVTIDRVEKIRADRREQDGLQTRARNAILSDQPEGDANHELNWQRCIRERLANMDIPFVDENDVPLDTQGDPDAHPLD